MDIMTIDEVRDTFNNVSYSFDMSSKAILLNGDSSTGKTLLFTIFQKHVSRKYPVVTIDSANQFNYTNIEHGSSFIIIDRFDVWGETLMRRRIDKALYTTGNKFVIISRYFGFAIPEKDHKQIVFKDNILQFA